MRTRGGRKKNATIFETADIVDSETLVDSGMEIKHRMQIQADRTDQEDSRQEFATISGTLVIADGVQTAGLVMTKKMLVTQASAEEDDGKTGEVTTTVVGTTTAVGTGPVGEVEESASSSRTTANVSLVKAVDTPTTSPL